MTRAALVLFPLGLAAVVAALGGCPQPDAVPGPEPTTSASSSSGTGAGGGGGTGGGHPVCAPCVEWVHSFPGHGTLDVTDAVIDGEDVILGGSYQGLAPFSATPQPKPTIFFARMHEQQVAATAVFPTGNPDPTDPAAPTVVTQLALAPGGALYAVGAFKDSFQLVEPLEITGHSQGFVAKLDPTTLDRKWGHALDTPDTGNGQIPYSLVSGVVAAGSAGAPTLAISGWVENGTFTAGGKTIDGSYGKNFVATFDASMGQPVTAIGLDEVAGVDWRIAANATKLFAAGDGLTYFASVLPPDASSQQRVAIPGTQPPIVDDAVAIPGSSDWLIAASIPFSPTQHQLVLVRMKQNGEYAVIWRSAKKSRFQVFTRVRFEPDGRLLALGNFQGDVDFGGQVGPIASNSPDPGDLFLVEFAADLTTVNWVLDFGTTAYSPYGGIAVTADNGFAYVVVPSLGGVSIDGKTYGGKRGEDSALLKLRLQ